MPRGNAASRSQARLSTTTERGAENVALGCPTTSERHRGGIPLSPAVSTAGEADNMDSVCNDAPDMRHSPDGMDDTGEESCTWCGAALAFVSGAWREVER